MDYLDANPNQKLVISGASNLVLSARTDITIRGNESKKLMINELVDARADAIIETLVNDYGVDKERLRKGTLATSTIPTQ